MRVRWLRNRAGREQRREAIREGKARRSVPRIYPCIHADQGCHAAAVVVCCASMGNDTSRDPARPRADRRPTWPTHGGRDAITSQSGAQEHAQKSARSDVRPPASHSTIVTGGMASSPVLSWDGGVAAMGLWDYVGRQPIRFTPHRAPQPYERKKRCNANNILAVIHSAHRACLVALRLLAHSCVNHHRSLRGCTARVASLSLPAPPCPSPHPDYIASDRPQHSRPLGNQTTHPPFPHTSPLLLLLLLLLLSR